MAPQPRGIIPPANAKRIAKAVADVAALAEAQTELRNAAVAALKAGGSVREVAEATGLSTRTVQDWGHADGWPTKAQKAAKVEARKRRKAELERLLGRYADDE